VIIGINMMMAMASPQCNHKHHHSRHGSQNAIIFKRHEKGKRTLLGSRSRERLEGGGAAAESEEEGGGAATESEEGLDAAGKKEGDTSE
jgi:hypothetical protein